MQKPIDTPMLKPIDSYAGEEDQDLLGFAQPCKARVDSLMDLIECEPAHIPLGVVADGSISEVPVMIDLGTKKRWFQFKGLKKLGIAAALLIALLLTPLNGTTFAGELVNWVNEIVISNGQTLFEASNSNRNLGLPDDMITTEIDTLEEVMEDLGTDAFNLSWLPDGYVFQEATRYTHGDVENLNYKILFKNSQGKAFLVGYIFDKTVILPSVVPGSVSYGIEAPKAQITEVDFLDGKAILIKNLGYYQINPVPITEEADDKRIMRSIVVAYPIEGHQPEWAEGMNFLELWYQKLLK